MPERRPRLLFICLKFTSFVEDDLALLRRHYDVRVFQFDAEASSLGGRILKLITEAVRQFFWLLRELPRADIVYGWFADYHMLLPIAVARRTGVPAVVMLGGFDCNHLPDLDYGVWDSSWRAPLVRNVTRGATLLLAGALSHLQSDTRYPSWPARHVDGLYAHVPALRTPCRVVPLGFDPEAWPMGPSEREAVVTTVAYVSSERDVRVKGIDLLIEAARRLPEARVQVVGVARDFAETIRARHQPPPNVQLHPPRARNDLPSIYAETSVYAQLSRVESFGCALAEAMLCGCVPVVSDVGGMPGLVGTCGKQVQQPNIERIAGALQEALTADAEARKQAHGRIERQFGIKQREKRLTEVLETVRLTTVAG